jgi:hypothetical protein
MTRLLDFLYLDIERIKSIISQLSGGVFETVLEKTRGAKEAKAGARVFGLLDAGVDLVRERSTEQTKSLRDYLYILFEQAAEEEGLFDTSFDFADPRAWSDADERDRLQEGQIVKVTAPTRILDANYFRETINATLEMPALIAAITSDDVALFQNNKEAKTRLKRLGDAMLGDPLAAPKMKLMAEFAQIFFNKQIMMRQFPCGVELPEFHFVGILNDQNSYLQEPRDVLYSKYGYGASIWTVVSQIALIPTPLPSAPMDAATQREFDRSAFEGILDALLITMQSSGFTQAPIAPSISVTPLAIYHEYLKD